MFRRTTSKLIDLMYSFVSSADLAFYTTQFYFIYIFQIYFILIARYYCKTAGSRRSSYKVFYHCKKGARLQKKRATQKKKKNKKEKRVYGVRY